MKSYRFIFGPVLSRRLGVSLGVDLLPYKTCSFDCVYCECGRTGTLTLERKLFFPPEAVIRELEEYLKGHPPLDWITFSGSGEPTLYLKLGEIISYLKKNFPEYKIALLTNSTLLGDPGVRKELRGLDLIVPSLDSATEEGMQAIDKPPGGVRPGEIIEGIKKTREESGGEIWLEIFIVPGINDTPGELEALKKAVEYIQPHKVQVNSLDRPGSEDWVRPLEEERKEYIRRILGAHVLNIKDERFRIRNEKSYIPFNTLKGQIIMALEKGPRTVRELSRELNFKERDLEKVLYVFLDQEVIIYDNTTQHYVLSGGIHRSVPEKKQGSE